MKYWYSRSKLILVLKNEALVLLKTKGDGKISLANAMSRVFAYFSATCNHALDLAKNGVKLKIVHSTFDSYV